MVTLLPHLSPQDKELWETYQTYVNKFLKSADPSLKDEDINRAVGLLWTNAFACSNGGIT